MSLLSFAIALWVDWRLGWPDSLLRRIGHPVIWAGRAIAALERRFNHGGQRRRLLCGGLVTLGLITLAALTGALLQGVVTLLSGSAVVTACIIGLCAWPLLASRSLYAHVEAVLLPLQRQDCGAARREVAKVVGRDPDKLDANGIRRAAIETLAENTSDGVIAPLFWGLLLGLPGICAYKMINTLDSMIAYRNPRYLYFGRVAARIDDVANWLPARLTALLLALSAGQPGVLRGLAGEAAQHRSPNAGWPETVMARLIGARLSGPRQYDTGPTDDAWLNGEAADPDNDAFARALWLFAGLIRLLSMVLVAAALFSLMR
ncbi:adenosylcobinamide-phosphate synthase CbiB [Granulosicoccaceae sp. 1_MG-2023]|nr:adenosylcobinamide-phosphate synthase CbiB [Granulosicoccaceae sp. 1_MG-2023]